MRRVQPAVFLNLAGDGDGDHLEGIWRAVARCTQVPGAIVPRALLLSHCERATRRLLDAVGLQRFPCARVSPPIPGQHVLTGPGITTMWRRR